MATLRRPDPTTDAPAEPVAVPAGEARRAGSSFDARYGKLIRTAGIGTVPFALFYYQAELGLQPQEVWFITYVLAHRWTSDLPFPSLAGMARHSGLTKRALRNYKDSLVAKGFLIVHERRRPDGGTTSHGYDFSPLFDRLDALIMRDLHVWGQRSPQLLSAARQGAHALHPGTEEADLPLPEAQPYPRGGGTDVPPAGKRVLSGRKRAVSLPPGYAPSPRIESDPVGIEETNRDTPELDPAGDAIVEDSRGRDDNNEKRHRPGNARRHDLRVPGDLDHLTAAPPGSHTSGDRPCPEPGGSAGIEPARRPAADTGRAAVHSAPAELPAPAALPDAAAGSDLERLIDELTERFGDAPEHRAANRTRARRLWRESGMAEPEFLALVREAERRTLGCAQRIRKRSTVSQNSANKIPYFFAVLSNLVRAGAQGGPHAADARRADARLPDPGAGQVRAGAPAAVVRYTASWPTGPQTEQGQDGPDALQAIWAAAREVLRARVSPASYRAFFEPAQPLRLEDGALVLAAADLFAYEMLRRRFSELLQSSVSEALGRPCRVIVLFPGEPVLPEGPAPYAHAGEQHVAGVAASPSGPDV